MRFSLSILPLLVAAFVLPACGGTDGDVPEGSLDQDATSSVVKTEAQIVALGSNPLAVKQGQKLVLKLKFEPGEPERWRFDGGNGQIGAPTESSSGSSLAVFTWTTGSEVVVGEHRIKMKLSKGPNGAAERALSFKVKVTPSAAARECPPPGIQRIPCGLVSTFREWCAPDYRAWAERSCDVEFED
jgi:hypothetical protein